MPERGGEEVTSKKKVSVGAYTQHLFWLKPRSESCEQTQEAYWNIPYFPEYDAHSSVRVKLDSVL